MSNTVTLCVGSGEVLLHPEWVSDCVYVTGKLSAHTTLILPKITGLWTFVNSTTGAYLLSVKIAGTASTVLLAQGLQQIFSDGSALSIGVSTGLDDATLVALTNSFAALSARYLALS